MTKLAGETLDAALVAPTLRGGECRRLQATTGSPSRSAAAIVALGVVIAFAAGCSRTNSSPDFRLNMQDILQAMDSHSPDEFRVTGAEKDDEERETKEANYKKLQFLSTALYAAFGTPDEPYLFEEARWNADEKKGLDLRKIELAAGPYGGDRERKQRGLFRQHCAHCHGVSGDGAGPTAGFLHPYPRDYRQGLFKFKSTERNAKPTDEDLKRILHEGVPGTAMPSFLLLPNDEIEALVEYVKYLSVRGEVERNMAFSLLINDDEIEPTKAVILEEYVQPAIDAWDEAEASVVNPEEEYVPPDSRTPEELRRSIAKGREIFFRKDAQCTKCHGPTALGDGNDGSPADQKLYDAWNDPKKTDALAAHWLLPIQELRPRNLRLGIYRGGRRPLDLYRRMHQGINGTPMPAAGRDEKSPTAPLTPAEIWNVVDYVRSLPYEAASEPAQFETTAMIE